MGCNRRLELFAIDSFQPVCLVVKKPLLQDATVRKRLAFARVTMFYGVMKVLACDLEMILHSFINCV